VLGRYPNLANPFAADPILSRAAAVWAALPNSRGGGVLRDLAPPAIRGTLAGTTGTDGTLAGTVRWRDVGDLTVLSADGTAGTTNYVDCGDATNVFGPADALTVVTCVRRAAIGGAVERICGDYNAAGGLCSWNIRLGVTGAPIFFFENPNGTFPSATATTTLASTALWYVIAATWDGTTRTIYVNGAAEGTNATAQTRADVGGNVHLFRSGSSTSGGFTGDIAYLAVFPVVLSADEVRALSAPRERAVVNRLSGWQTAARYAAEAAAPPAGTTSMLTLLGVG